MAIQTIKKSGYGVVEFNNFSAQRIGRNKAQLPLSPVDFTDETTPCEQGMLLVYNEAVGAVSKPIAITEDLMLHKSEEKLYDERRPALKNFALFGDHTTTVQIVTTNAEGVESTQNVDFVTAENPYPRLYQLDVGDTWTSNTVTYDDAVFADFSTIATGIKAGTVYGVVQVGLEGAQAKLNGYISLVKTFPATSKTPIKAIKAYTMPDGSPGIKFEVIRK